jgi:glycosyltransferase involved in cell wall biosynthesis
MATKQKSVDLTVVIPCYNEEESVAECVKRVPQMPWSTEILVVDDNSQDNTYKVAKAIKDPRLRVITHTINPHGKGLACKLGVNNARGKVTVIQDVDMSPEDIPAIVRPIFDGRADFVNGTRMLMEMEPGAMSTFNKVGNRLVFGPLVSILVRKWLTDTLCGYKAFRTSLLRNKLTEISWPDFEMLVKARRQGARITEVPIYYVSRKRGTSKMQPLKHGWRMLKMIAKLAVVR